MSRRIREGNIRDIMTSPVPTVRPDTSTGNLNVLFALHDTSAFAVVDEERRLRGVVTAFDLLRAFRSPRSRWIPDLRALWGERVEDIMNRGLWTLGAHEPIASAVEMMLNRNVSAVPVVEGGYGDARLIGMVRLRDVLGSLIFESPAAHARNVANGKRARYGEQAEGQHVSARLRDNDPHAWEAQARRAS